MLAMIKNIIKGMFIAVALVALAAGLSYGGFLLIGIFVGGTVQAIFAALLAIIVVYAIVCTVLDSVPMDAEYDDGLY